MTTIISSNGASSVQVATAKEAIALQSILGKYGIKVDVVGTQKKASGQNG
jgi:hypothetical protein